MTRWHARGALRRPRAHRSAAAAVLGLTLSALLSSGLALDLPSALAAPAAGTWGGLNYRAGTVCQSGGVASPLASWNLGGGVSAAYLVQPVSSANGVNSAVPPFASLGAQSQSPVGSGSAVGQLDPSQVPALAALLGRYGSSGDDTVVAALAHLVMSSVGGDAGVPTCQDVVAEQRLQSQAGILAGPYTLAFADHPAQSLPGRADSTTVTVTGASGAPVPGVEVTIGADTAIFGNASSTTATTDSAGRATARFTVPVGTPAAGIGLTASASVPTSLTAVTIQAGPTATNPSGSSVPALVPGGDSASQATASIRLDRSAHPVLSLAADPSAALAGTEITPTLTVTGLNGHQATATITTVGPLPLTERTLCSSRTAADFTAASGTRPGSVNSTVNLVRDGVVKAAGVTPKSPGCYWSTARLTTTDATPQATATASVPRAITVLDTAVSARLGTTLVGRNGSADITLSVQRAHSAGLSLRTVVTGPVRPPDSAKGCASADYSSAADITDDPRLSSGAGAGAPTATPVAGTTIRHAAVRSAGLGCSRVRIQLVLDTGSENLAVQVPLSGSDDLLAIAPAVQVSTQRRWGQTGQSVTVLATVVSTVNQPGHVSVSLRRTDTTEFGCLDANFDDATTGSAGAGVAVTTDYTPVQVRSVTVTKTGCYQPVVTLRMDGNATITVASATLAGTVIAVGVDPAPTATGDTGLSTPDGASVQPILWALLGFALAVLAAIVVTLRLARDPEPDAGSAGTLVLTQRPSPN